MQLGIDEPIGDKICKVFVGIGLSVVTQKIGNARGFFGKTRLEGFVFVDPAIPTGAIGGVVHEFVKHHQIITLPQINSFVVIAGKSGVLAGAVVSADGVFELGKIRLVLEFPMLSLKIVIPAFGQEIGGDQYGIAIMIILARPSCAGDGVGQRDGWVVDGQEVPLIKLFDERLKSFGSHITGLELVGSGNPRENCGNVGLSIDVAVIFVGEQIVVKISGIREDTIEWHQGAPDHIGGDTVATVEEIFFDRANQAKFGQFVGVDRTTEPFGDDVE